MRITDFEDFRVQLRKTKSESFDFLNSIKSIEQFLTGSQEQDKSSMFRTIAVPMIYSSWEVFLLKQYLYA